jgi:hypothetical protein
MTLPVATPALGIALLEAADEAVVVISQIDEVVKRRLHGVDDSLVPRRIPGYKVFFPPTGG